ncbi:MAG: LysR family transcriptional regulator [Gammaproteobacteria bacterium]|nr:LysR family transcriptional regulator [Gammaproteobacteria bacterium]MDD9874946.1 LysR family transcriptional regulator [Gammaproteobacteria bacterium]
MPLHITLRQLQVFETVARHLSYTRAAEELHLTQPAVSMQVKQLEGMVELPLFEVVGRKVHLTRAGHTLLAHSRAMLSRLRDMECEVKRMKGVDGGSLKICITPTVNYFATRLLSRFCTLYPQVGVSLKVTGRCELARRLSVNEPDLVLMGLPSPGLGVEATAFMENPLIVIANPQHPLVGQRKIPLEDIENESFVMREPGSDTRLAMQRLFDKHGLTLAPGTESSSVETVKQRVEAGLGLAVVSAHTVELELNAGRLASLDLRHFPIIRKWYIAYRKGKRLSRTGKAFFDFVLQEGRKRRYS